jgi:hypothetical protein
MERAQNHELNSRLCQLPGIYEQAPGPGVKRVYWAHNHLFIDPAKAGLPPGVYDIPDPAHNVPPSSIHFGPDGAIDHPPLGNPAVTP